MGGNVSVVSLNGLFKEVYADKLTDLLLTAEELYYKNHIKNWMNT